MTQDAAPRHILAQEKLITGAASKVIDRLLSAAEEKFRNEWAKRRNSQLKGLTALIKNQTATYSKIKNILYYNESVPLNDLYVSLNLEKSEVPHSDDTVFRQAQNGRLCSDMK